MKLIYLLDNSTSMQKHQRKLALCHTLYSVAWWATRLDFTGISVRFLNSNTDRKLNKLFSARQINDMVKKEGHAEGTLLGRRLDEKIIQPMIIEPARRKTLERPVLVVMITDGEVFKPPI